MSNYFELNSNNPLNKPVNPSFSSGPCAKHPGWSLFELKSAVAGRSHRSVAALGRIQECLSLTRTLLEVPEDYKIAIVPGSDTGAIEMAMWSLLGPRPVTVLAWEHFGRLWAEDARTQLGISAVNILESTFDPRPDLDGIDWTNDVVFVWNGTSTGVCLPDGDWIADCRQGLTICDATSAAFGLELPLEKLDVTTFSWQKCLGGEAGHGVLILSPRAVARLHDYAAARPLPKLFRLTRNGKLLPGLFDGGVTINTVSMLCVEDAVSAMKWGLDQGGLVALQARVRANYEVIANWVVRTPWVDFLHPVEGCRSPISVCLRFADERISNLSETDQRAFSLQMTKQLAAAGAALDIEGFRTAPPGLRIWCGPTVAHTDIAMLLPWLDWAFATQVASLKN